MKPGIIGCGFSGQAIGLRMAGDTMPVWGTTRSPDKFPALELAGVQPVLFDGETINPAMLAELANTSHLVISIAPARTAETSHPVTDPFLASLAATLPGKTLLDICPNLEWIGYLSTVGVYGNHDGAWVDETTPVAPESERSMQRVLAENEWLALDHERSIPVAVFRLSGIYGPGRNALLTANEGKSRRLVKKGQVFNRIHVADIARAVERAALAKAAGIFNITDNEPAPPQDVVAFAHQVLGTEPPEEIDFETAVLSPMARSFYGENKRVSNQKSKDILGMVYTYPDYRTALAKMHAEDSWKG